MWTWGEAGCRLREGAGDGLWGRQGVDWEGGRGGLGEERRPGVHWGEETAVIT